MGWSSLNPSSRRGLDHTLSHQRPPPLPPYPPSPPSPPPSNPPPPPLEFVLSGVTMISVMIVLSALVGIGIVVQRVRAKRKGEKVPTQDADANKGAKDADAKEGEKGLEGPQALRSRGCTDICCLIIFIFFWCGAMYVMYLSMTVGDPYSVIYGKDYLGNRCGRGAFANRPKVIFPRLNRDVLAQAPLVTTAPWKLVLYGLCVESCPNVTDPIVCVNDPSKCMYYDYGTPSQWRAAGGASFYFQGLPTISLINRCVPIARVAANAAPDRCVWPQCDNVTNPWMLCDATFPKLWLPRGMLQRSKCEIKYQESTVTGLASQEPSPVVDQIAAHMAAGQEVVEGIMQAQHEIWVYGVILPVILGFAWLVLLRFFAKTIIFGALIAIGVGLFLLSCYLFIITGLAAEIVAQVLANNNTMTMLATAAQMQADLIGDAGSGPAYNASANASAPVASAALNYALENANEMTTQITGMLPGGLGDAAAGAQGDDSVLWRLAAWGCLALTLIYFILMFLWRAKIRLAATLVKESSLVIKDRPFSIVAPFFNFAAVLLLLLWFILTILFLGTADITMDHLTGQGFPLTSGATFAQLLMANNATMNSGGVDDLVAASTSILTPKNVCYSILLFAFLWTNEFFNCVCFTSLSGQYSHWYFFRRDPKQSTRFPLCWAFYRTVRYHLGTIAMGSFIIALVQFIRIAMEALDRQTKKLQETNKMMVYAIKCAKCALYCLEKCLKFITSYCYIYTALQGTSFCMSCIATFTLIMGQPIQLALNTLVRTILTLLQLIGIPALCAFLTNATLVERMSAQPMYPTGFVLLTAFVITKCFAIVFSCVLDTLFVCCVRDKADYKAAFMSDALYEAFGFDPAERSAVGGGTGSCGGGDGPQAVTAETKQVI